MTDNEIIKALERYRGQKLFAFNGKKPEVYIHDIIDLINRLKAEIERLKKENLELEIEKFKCNTKVGTLTGRITLMERDIPFIKAEAIKDFAKRLVHTLVINNEENTEFFDFSYTLETIDNLVKEMIGEQE